jgi:hypothetical protein
MRKNSIFDLVFTLFPSATTETEQIESYQVRLASYQAQSPWREE